jgi:mannosyl-glycoprotein endo-beta-N-acetylglucosaminidase
MTVEVFMYDITGGMAAQLSLPLLGMHLEGVWHTSIVAFGREFYFDGGVGIVEGVPRRTRFGNPLKTQRYRDAVVSEAQFRAWIASEGRSAFGPNDYNLLNKNCNNFTAVALQVVSNDTLHPDVTQMIPRILATPLGAMFRPMLESVNSRDGVNGLGGAAASFLQGQGLATFDQPPAAAAAAAAPPPAAAAASAQPPTAAPAPISEDELNLIVESLRPAEAREDLEFLLNVTSTGGVGTFMPPSERSMRALKALGFRPVAGEEYLVEAPAGCSDNVELLGIMLSGLNSE